MNNSELALLTLFAIVIAPLLAVQAQKWLDRYHESKNRKLAIFKTLMMNRATPISPIYVQALNLIDVEFDRQDERAVRDAWKVLLDFFYDAAAPGKKVDEDRSRELTVNLLVEMGKCLGYDFDRVQVKKGVYRPIGLITVEEQQHGIREKLLEVLDGKRRLPVAIFEQKFPPLAGAPKVDEESQN